MTAGAAVVETFFLATTRLMRFGVFTGWLSIGFFLTGPGTGYRSKSVHQIVNNIHCFCQCKPRCKAGFIFQNPEPSI